MELLNISTHSKWFEEEKKPYYSPKQGCYREWVFLFENIQYAKSKKKTFIQIFLCHNFPFFSFHVWVSTIQWLNIRSARFSLCKLLTQNTNNEPSYERQKNRPKIELSKICLAWTIVRCNFPLASFFLSVKQHFFAGIDKYSSKVVINTSTLLLDGVE